jgi:hypothetical protein
VGGVPDIGAFELQSAVGPALPGDYNGDDVVGAADYILWRKTYGSPVPAFTGADGNGNATVDDPDYGVWQANFGSTSPGAAAASILNEAAPGAAAASFAPLVAPEEVRSAAFDALLFSQLDHSPYLSPRGGLAISVAPANASYTLVDRASDAALLALLVEQDEIVSFARSESPTVEWTHDTQPPPSGIPLDPLLSLLSIANLSG